MDVWSHVERSALTVDLTRRLGIVGLLNVLGIINKGHPQRGAGWVQLGPKRTGGEGESRALRMFTSFYKFLNSYSCLCVTETSYNSNSQKRSPRAKCGPRRHEMRPAEGKQICILVWPAILQSAARSTARGPHFSWDAMCTWECGPQGKHSYWILCILLLIVNTNI